MLEFVVHHGQCAFKKSLFEKVQWTKKKFGEDKTFTSDMYAMLPQNKVLILLADLVCYHVERTFSSGSITNFHDIYKKRKAMQKKFMDLSSIPFVLQKSVLALP